MLFCCSRSDHSSEQQSLEDNEQARETQIRIREYEDSEGVIPVADLTEYLFGRIDISELAGREGVLMSEHLAQELEKIEKLSRVCFNEVV